MIHNGDETIPAGSGFYALHLRVDRPQTLWIGKLGNILPGGAEVVSIITKELFIMPG